MSGERDRAATLRLDMVETQLRRRRVADPRVLRAFETVPRETFVPGVPLEDAYSDRPIAIARGQTISQPYVVALMCQLLALSPGHRALEVGAGSGYAAAILAELGARVVALERIGELAALAKRNLAAAGYADRVDVRQGDGSVGCPDAAPFDRILVSAAAPAVPKALLDQLAAADGVLVAPIGAEAEQTITVVRRSSDGFRTESFGRCTFVKLLGRDAFPPPADAGEAG